MKYPLSTPVRALLLAALVLGLTGIGVGAAPDVSWSFGPSSPFFGTRFDGESVNAQGRVYFLGFRNEVNATDGSVWYYDIAAGTYTDTGVDMPKPVSNYGIAPLKDATGYGLYIFGGRDDLGEIVTDVQVYYPMTNTTATIATDPWPGMTPAGCVSLPAMGVATIGNRAFVLGGLSFASSIPPCIDDQSAQTWTFNPLGAAGNRWKQGPDLNVARGYITPAVLGATIYAIGGDTIDAGSLFPIDTVESWTIPSGTWDDAGVADLPLPCDESQAFGIKKGTLANHIVLAGCGQWPQATSDSFLYDATANSWSFSDPLNETRRNHAGAMFKTSDGSQMFVLGGYEALSGFSIPTNTSEMSAPSLLGGASGAGRPAAAPNASIPTH